MRLALELHAAEAAVGRVDDRELRRFRELMDATAAAVSHEEWDAANAAFHEYQVDLAGNELLSRFYRELSVNLMMQVIRGGRLEAGSYLATEHGAIVDGVRGGRPATRPKRRDPRAHRHGPADRAGRDRGSGRGPLDRRGRAAIVAVAGRCRVGRAYTAFAAVLRRLRASRRRGVRRDFVRRLSPYGPSAVVLRASSSPGRSTCPSPAPTITCSVFGGQCTKSHCRNGRSWPSTISSVSPESTRNASVSVSQWYIELGSPG